MAPTPPKPPSAPAPERSNTARMATWAFFALVVFTMLAFFNTDRSSGDEVSFTEYIARVEDGVVRSVERNNATGEITFTLNDSSETVFATSGPVPASEAELELLNQKVPPATADNLEAGVTFVTPSENALVQLLFFLLPVGLLIGFFVWMQRRAQGQMGGIMNVGRSKAKTYTTERPGTTFDDVAGYAGVKREITEVVDFLKNPDRFSEIGARTPKGMLLVGPPGTGKTLIARAVAGEAGVPFMSVTGSDFMEMFVGVGASRVRDLFENARKMGRAIIFIDEIDSIGRKRGAGMGGGHDEREQTLNQMLSEMDGFESSEGIIMLAATNRPDILDPALLRPGRFDRQVVVPLPELDDRKEILAVHLKGKRSEPDLDVSVIARGTPGMSGADLANLVNEAALFAVRAGDTKIGMSHFDAARDRVLLGIERTSMVQTKEEVERTAYHEAGHALCAAVQDNHDPVHKVTIIPTGMALGVTMTLPVSDRHSMDKDEAEAMMVMAMGGRVAEALVFNESSSGAANDLQQATNVARRMVTEWGMSEILGPMSLSDSGPVFLGEDMMGTKSHSPDTARLIDEETRRILIKAEDRCRELLIEYRNGLDLIARSLLEHESINGDEVYRLLNLSGANLTLPSVTALTADAAAAADDGTEAPVEQDAAEQDATETDDLEELADSDVSDLETAE
ncbi:MAG: cell division protease FtsH [Verrucomicrobiales bacterium]|jgi:cell division protease FtsH